jgi:hypothetical protein
MIYYRVCKLVIEKPPEGGLGVEPMFGQNDQQQNATPDTTDPVASDLAAKSQNDNVTAASPAFTSSAPPLASGAKTSSPPPAVATDDDILATSGSDDLLNLKQEALQHLSPLVSHLDQSPEEKFKTTMMMIQASDDQSLVKSAYEAAKQIKDEKARAQALLDIVNEINYFTQHHNN